MRTVAVLVAAMIGCALTLRFGPVVAEAATGLGGDGMFSSAAAIETLYAAVIFGSLLLIALAGGAWCRVDPLRLGRRPTAMLGTGIAIGATGVLISLSMAWIAGIVDRRALPSFDGVQLLWGSAVILFAAAAEEIYFRGWLQPVLARTLGLPAAVALSALAFAALHVMGGARSPTTLVNLFLGGLLFGLLAARGGLAGAVGVHFAWNWTERIGLGLDPNPGIGSFGALVDLDLAGRALWGGSDEGLNGGLGMTVALFALLVPVVILTRDRLAPAAGAAPAERRVGEGAW